MKNPVDWLEVGNAHRLAAKIRGYWFERGYNVSVWVEEQPPKQRTIHQGFVRSDMVNGMPTKKIATTHGAIRAD